MFRSPEESGFILFSRHRPGAEDLQVSACSCTVMMPCLHSMQWTFATRAQSLGCRDHRAIQFVPRRCLQMAGTLVCRRNPPAHTNGGNSVLGLQYVRQKQQMTATFCLFQRSIVRPGLMAHCGCMVANSGVNQLPVKVCRLSRSDE